MSLRSKLTNKAHLLIFGYVRDIEDVIEYYIPDTIYIICVKYYHFNHFIIYLSQDSKLNPNGIYLADLEEENKNNNMRNKTQCCVIDLQSNKSNKPKENKNNKTQNKTVFKYFNQDPKWVIYDSGMCYATNIALPDDIHQEILNYKPAQKSAMLKRYLMMKKQTVKIFEQKASQELTNNYHMIFKAGGFHYSEYKANNYCSAIVLNTMKLNSLTNSVNMDLISWFNWELPELPKLVFGNTLLFSQYYNTLYSIGGGESKNVFALSFDEKLTGLLDAQQSWMWNTLPIMTGTRYAPACCMITNKSNGKQSLCVIGGRSRIIDPTTPEKQAAEIYDFEEEKWSELKTKSEFGRPNLYRAGIYYDENPGKIYVGGGQSPSPSYYVQYCDLNKMEWLQLPCTRLKHNFYPILWKDNNEILYIASTNGNRVEWLDLRQYQKQTQILDKKRLDLMKWHGFVDETGNVEFTARRNLHDLRRKLHDQGSELSDVLNTRFPKDCCVAKLLSANAT